MSMVAEMVGFDYEDMVSLALVMVPLAAASAALMSSRLILLLVAIHVVGDPSSALLLH